MPEPRTEMQFFFPEKFFQLLDPQIPRSLQEEDEARAEDPWSEIDLKVGTDRVFGGKYGVKK